MKLEELKINGYYVYVNRHGSSVVKVLDIYKDNRILLERLDSMSGRMSFLIPHKESYFLFEGDGIKGIETAQCWFRLISAKFHYNNRRRSIKQELYPSRYGVFELEEQSKSYLRRPECKEYAEYITTKVHLNKHFKEWRKR